MYPSQEPRHWGTLRRFAEGGGDPLDGVSGYAADSPPHWHYVSFGLTAWGFEFSFRVARGDETAPPLWPVPFLQQLARYVVNTGEPFGHGHYVAWGGPITHDEPTDLVALLFTADQGMGTLTVGDDELTFLTPVGLKEAEYEECAAGRSEAVLHRTLARNPLGVVRLQREPLT